MRYIKLTFIVLGLFLFGCNQDSKNTNATNEISADSLDDKTNEQS